MKSLDIAYDKLPEAERGPVWRLYTLFIELDMYAMRFRHAVELFEASAAAINRDFADLQDAISQPDPRPQQAQLRGNMKRHQSWSFCAAEWAAMQVFHFEKVADVLLAARGNQELPLFASYLNKVAMRVPRDLFARAFPDHADVRHAAGHMGEFARDPEKHAVRGEFSEAGLEAEPGAATMVSAHIGGRTYCATVNGRLVKFEMSQESASALDLVIERAADAFADAVSALEAVPAGGTLQARRPHP